MASSFITENFNITNEYIKLYFNSNNHLISLTDVKRSSSLQLSIELTEVLESVGKPFDSVCDGTNVYTFVPMEGSNSSRNLLPNDEVSKHFIKIPLHCKHFISNFIMH